MCRYGSTPAINCQFQGDGQLSNSRIEYTLNDDNESYSVTGIGTATDTDIIIPSTHNDKPITSIGSRAFSGCDLLTSVTIPDSVRCIMAKNSLVDDNSPFFGCDSLSSINYLGTIESRCNIQGLNYLMNYGTSSKKLVINGKEITGELVIPNTVTSVPSFAFHNCTNITSVTFEESSQCTSIEQYALYGCSSLKTVYYTGTWGDWKKIIIYSGNSNLTSATYYYGAKPSPH